MNTTVNQCSAFSSPCGGGWEGASLVILDADTLGANVNLNRFSDFGAVRIFAQTAKHERLAHIGNAQIIITNKVIIDKEIIDACEQLQLVCLTATGMNNVDVEYAKRKGIAVKNVAGYSTHSVAQHTFALLLSLMHHIEYYSNYVASKTYSQQNLFTHIQQGYSELYGKTWGIIGLGAIGRAVAKIAEAFGCKVCYYSTSGKNATSDYEQKSLNDLLASSDIVSIHAPLNEQTLGLIGAKELQQMKSSAYLINVGRGGIVNEPDLAQALRCNEIAGACLDVMQQEPLPENSPLLADDLRAKLLITPHIAWISNEALETLMNRVYEHICEFLDACVAAGAKLISQSKSADDYPYDREEVANLLRIRRNMTEGNTKEVDINNFWN
ncbi:MAG: D-2-hydroxyacid dehydrogenase [Bacteroidetes bacterium]|nr:D-2-hydroxyacid dehydrogenase [Bacteroidota bacterium]